MVVVMVMVAEGIDEGAGAFEIESFFFPFLCSAHN